MPKILTYCFVVLDWFLRFLLLPMIRILAIFNINLSRRVEFEKKSQELPCATSFHRINKCAHVCFEVSSEGELEQIRPILVELLNRQHLVELIYCSASVQSQCEQLAQSFAQNIRVVSLPLLSDCVGASFNLREWVTAPTLVFCRYDFFPQLMALKWHNNMKLVLVSGTMKNKSKLWGVLHLRLFHHIVAATANDLEKIRTIAPHIKIDAFDFRTVQVTNRLKQSVKKLESHRYLHNWLDHLEKQPKTNRIIFGSFWPVEAQVFAHEGLQQAIANETCEVAIAPHVLNQESFDAIEMQIKKYFPTGQIQRIGHELLDQNFQATIKLITVKGVLVELYTYFAHAFVGGGHGRSIHSLLEPHLAGCQTYCGPKTHRSTEYDYIHELNPERIKIVESLDSFYDHYLIANKLNFEALNLNQLSRDGLKKVHEFIEETICS